VIEKRFLCTPFRVPLYGFISFIFHFLNRQKCNEKERGLLMRFYGVPTVIILIGGIIFKIIFYKLKYGNYFLDEIYYYYFLGARKDYLISSFIILVIVFVVFLFS
jgi:preprotein translocase subunit YajC